MLAKNIRFLIPFTLSQITEARGNYINEHITNLLQIFKGDYDKIIHWVQPVITKVKPKGDEFNLELKKGQLQDMFKRTLENMAQ